MNTTNTMNDTTTAADATLDGFTATVREAVDCHDAATAFEMIAAAVCSVQQQRREIANAAARAAQEAQRLVCPEPTDLELHLDGDPTFTRRFGAKVRAMGGRYSECRGNQFKRFVTVPLAAEGAHDLIAEMIRRHAPRLSVTVIVRGGGAGRLPALVVVHRAAKDDPSPVATVLAEYRRRHAAFVAEFGAR